MGGTGLTLIVLGLKNQPCRIGLKRLAKRHALYIFLLTVVVHMEINLKGKDRFASTSEANNVDPSVQREHYMNPFSP